MAISRHSVFRSAAQVAGLLTAEQLDEVLRAVSDSQTDIPTSDAETPADIDDEQLAAKAIELGFLNRWQVEQLKAGKTKFTLGPYRIFDSIGKGGMGDVFKGEHTMLGRIEAVKVLPKHKTTPDSIVRFHREIRAQAQLDHPNLVRLTFAGQDGAAWFFVTEYVPGIDLRKLVRRRGKLSMTEAATIISQTAEGLAYAHERHLVHRDIKPGNILVTPDGRTKVIDLGLAAFLHDEVEAKERGEGKIVGTADYLAPETSPTEINPVSDIYSLGCTLYYAVTGKVPFPGGTTVEKLRRHRTEPPNDPRRFNPELSEKFLAVLAAMMEKDPAQRLQSARDVVKCLAPWTLERVPNPQGEDAAAPAARSAVSDSPATLPHSRTVFGDELDAILQSSQATDPLDLSLQETLPIERRILRALKPRYFSWGDMLVLFMLAAAICITAIVLVKVLW